MDAPIQTILSNVLSNHVGEELTVALGARIITKVMDAVYPGAVNLAGIAPKRVGNYTLAPMRLAGNIHRLRAMHEAHWLETETHRHDQALDIDYDRVCWLELQGRYVLIGVTADDGTLVGNYGLYLANSVHTKELVATEDTLFLMAAHRHGRVGISLIRYAEDALRHLGVTELNVTVKKVNTVGRMIEKMGYPAVATQHTKRLKEAAHVLA